MQWMTTTSFVPCHVLHALQHAAASPFGPLNHSNDFFWQWGVLRVMLVTWLLHAKLNPRPGQQHSFVD